MFWVREVIGWTLIALGVITFAICYFVLIRNNKILAAGPTVLMGIFLFRGGIHLLKVAVAARLCQQSEPKRSWPAASARLR